MRVDTQASKAIGRMIASASALRRGRQKTVHRPMVGSGEGRSRKPDQVRDLSTINGSEPAGEEHPLHASGIAWIDCAYSVVRELRLRSSGY